MDVGGMLATIVGSLATTLIAVEAKSWTPWLTERLIDRAVSRLPRALQARYAEEWRSYVADFPSPIGQLIKAATLGSAGAKIAPVQHHYGPLSLIDLETAKVAAPRNISSSIIRRFEYFDSAGRLVVTFVSGRQYAFRNVPANVAEGMRAAHSKGEYFNRVIKDRYAVRRVR